MVKFNVIDKYINKYDNCYNVNLKKILYVEKNKYKYKFWFCLKGVDLR